MKYLISLILFAGALVISAYAQDTAITQKADSLFSNHKEEEALDVFNQILMEHPDNFDALWKSSLLYARIGHRLKKKDDEKAYYNKAKERAEKALSLKPDDTNSNFVMGVAMGRMALIVGTKARVAASRDIKKYADKALEADSTNSGAWHLLGRWNYEVANLNFAERMAANLLFGGIPSASTEDAVLDIKKAIALNPDFLLSYYDLARSYKELDKDQQAIATCRQALQKPSKAPDDDSIKKDCRDLIKDLQ